MPAGLSTRRSRSCRSRTSPKRKARSRTSADACSGSCRRRPRRGSRGRAGSSSPTCSASLGEAERVLRRRPTSSPRSRRATRQFAGLSYDTIGLRGLPIHGATAAPAAAGGAAVIVNPVLAVLATLHNIGDEVLPFWRVRHRDGRQDGRRLHGLHGRRRAAHAGRAQDLGVDSGPARSEPRGRQARSAPAGRGRRQEHHEGRDAAGRT